MLGPIALYPDPLIAQLLPAATLPSEIVLADRYVESGGDPNLVDQQGWDSSVAALSRYPTVLKWLDDNLAWTTAIGQAFLYQQQDVMDSIQRLRAQAEALGNLQTTPQETVVTDDGTIEILPADPAVIYVPVYQPNVVFVQRPYGFPLISFGAGFAVGAWLDHDFDWHNHNVVVWDHDHPRPGDWWSHRPEERRPVVASHTTVWQSRNRPPVSPANVDRGWGNAQAHSTATVIGHQTGAREPERAPAPAPHVERPAPAVEHQVEAPQSHPANGALIGVQSSHATQQFSNRGQASRQTISRPAAGSGRR
jgi:hypothetical protein